MSALRWHAKKAARYATVAASVAGRSLRPRAGARIRALTYHRFGDAPRDPFCIAAAAFERHMRWLAEAGLAVTLDDVAAFVAGAKPLPDDAVLVTIDDACPSAYATALPILRAHAIPAVLFVPAGELVPAASDPPAAETSASRMSVAELRAVAAAGIAIGSHGWHHVSFGRMAAATALEHAARSRARLEELVDAPVTAFAYPFGTRADYDATTTAALRAAGYRLAFTSQHGAIRPGNDGLVLPRIKVEGGEPPWIFPLLAHGALDAWGLVDRTLWRLQAAHG